MKTFKWFKNRINQKVYRDHHDCCTTCQDNYENGLIIADEQHAQYLFDLQNDFGAEGFELNYRDKR